MPEKTPAGSRSNSLSLAFDDQAVSPGPVHACAEIVRSLSGWHLAGQDTVRNLPLSEIHLDGVDGVTVYAGEEGLQVRLGTGETAPKLERLKSVLAALRADGKRADSVLLDNRAHPSWVTVRPAGTGGARVAGTGPRGS